jgi:hypothetical protein
VTSNQNLLFREHYIRQGGDASNPVILSEAKDLSLGSAQILRSAQDDSSADTQDDSTAEVHVYGVVTTPLKSSVSVH